MRLAPYQRAILGAICANDRIKAFEVPDLSGYSDGSCMRGLTELKGLRLIENHHCRWSATECGKIAFALLVGQQARRRSHRAEA